MCYLKTVLSLFFLTGFVFSIPATAQERQSDERELASSTMLPAENEPSENASLELPAAEIPDEYKNMTLEKAGISATANKEAKKKKTKNQFKPDEEYLLQGLTLEHKVAQMLMVSVDAADTSAAEYAAYSGLGSVQLQWGSYSLEETKKITKRLQTKARQAGFPPLFISVDYEGGSVYVPTTLGLLELPTNMMLGAANNVGDTATLFYLAGKELRKTGINMALAPALDINTNPKNPIIGVRSLGADPIKTAELGKAIINGFRASNIMTIAKHFPGHGATYEDTHKKMPEIKMTAEEISDTHLYPFKEAMKAGVDGIMTVHILFSQLDPDNPVTLSSTVIQGMIRQKMEYNGLVMTDSLDMSGITSRMSIKKAAAAAVKAGADIILLGKGNFKAALEEIVSQVERKEIPMSRIDEAYNKIIAAKEKAGLLKKEADDTNTEADKAYMQITERISEQAITLLKDRKKVIPIPLKSKVAIIIFAPQRFANNAIQLYKEFLANGYDVTQYYYGIGVKEKEKAKIMEAAAAADTLVIGSFQWAAAQNMSQKEMIKKLLATGKPSVLMSLMSPYDMLNYPEAPCSMVLYGMTAPAMSAAGKVLTGAISPMGKLPILLR